MFDSMYFATFDVFIKNFIITLSSHRLQGGDLCTIGMDISELKALSNSRDVDRV